MNALDRLQAELAAQLLEQQRRMDDQVGVTVGRAAQMLRMTRRVVWDYIVAGELRGEWIEGAEVRRGQRVRQLVLRKREVRRFRQLLEDRRRRRPTSHTKQLGLPLFEAPTLTPASWALAKFKPRMIRAGRAKAHDRVVEHPPTAKEKRHVA